MNAFKEQKRILSLIILYAGQRRNTSMNNDMLKLYKYLSEKHPESADQIFYGVTLVQQYLEKSVDDLKNDMKRAIDEGDYKSISCYFDLVKDIKSSYDMLLQEMAQISKEMEPIKELDTMPGQQVLDEAFENH